VYGNRRRSWKNTNLFMPVDDIAADTNRGLRDNLFIALSLFSQRFTDPLGGHWEPAELHPYGVVDRVRD
jgi:hypothetical protein